MLDLETRINSIASSIMFGICKTENLQEYLDKYSLEFRKGKGIKDINKALEKSKKNGRGKTEFEENFFQLYCRIEVFKNKRYVNAMKGGN